MSWSDAAIVVAQVLQSSLLRAWHGLGLSGDAAGQPAWPWGWRIAVENLAIDGGLARSLSISVLATIAAVGLCVFAVTLPRWRWPLSAMAAALLLLAPWPSRMLVLTDATPTSFHRSTTGFTVASIARGMAVYDANCLRCHGTRGHGDGPDAALLAHWPPTVAGSMLWKRAEGELFWSLRQGGRGMPGFAQAVSDDDLWSALAAMKALAAAEGSRQRVGWTWPLRAPDFAVRCGSRNLRLQDLRLQRIRLVLGGGSLPRPIEDPRFATVVIGKDAGGAECNGVSPDAPLAYALIAGLAPGDAAGAQFIVDRDGWLRALGRPGQAAWSEDDLMCRSDRPRNPVAGGLDALIATMDAEPVVTGRVGAVHAR